MSNKPPKPDDCEEHLEECRRENRVLAHILSHDLREPLRMVTSYMDLLNTRYRGKLDETADEFIRYAIEGAWRAEAMLDGLLEYSRIANGAGTPVHVDTNTVVQAAVERLRAEHPDVAFDIEAPALPAVHADPDHMRRLWGHLLRNAVTFREPSRPLRVSIDAERDGRYWRFTVADNGMGFEQKQADKVFELLQKLHPVGRYPGVGAGLAVARRVVRHYGGRIGVESRRGEGSRFWLSLPVVD